jgi:hypothetical protein
LTDSTETFSSVFSIFSQDENHAGISSAAAKINAKRFMKDGYLLQI